VPLERSNFAYVLGSSGVASSEANSFGKMFMKMLTHLHMVVYDAFEKIKCIFSIALVGNLEKSWECFSKHSPDAGVGSTARWSRASGVVSVCGSGVQSAPNADIGRWAVTVYASGVE